MDDNEAEAKLYNHTNHLISAHETLLADANRNRAFYRALKQTVKEDSSVLDIGSGTGIWAVAAAKLGARRVVAIEEEPLLISVIKDFAQQSGVADRVEVINSDSRQVQLSREFDIVVSETIGHLVFDEPIVPIMIDARERLLKAGGFLIPQRVTLVTAGAHLESRDKLPAGIPLEHNCFESLALNTPLTLKTRSDLQVVTDRQELISADLNSVREMPPLAHLTARWELPKVGRINCFAVWAEVTLLDDLRLTTDETASWFPMIYRIRPFEAKRGELEFKLSLTNKSHYWEASLSSDENQEVQRYSPAYAAAELLALTRIEKDALGQINQLTFTHAN